MADHICKGQDDICRVSVVQAECSREEDELSKALIVRGASECHQSRGLEMSNPFSVVTVQVVSKRTRASHTIFRFPYLIIGLPTDGTLTLPGLSGREQPCGVSRYRALLEIWLFL